MKNSDAPGPLTTRSERRSKTRQRHEDCYNAEIKILGYPIYQVKIANISPIGAGILVKEASSLLRLLTVGRILDVRFHCDAQENRTDAVVQFKAEVKHISELKHGRYRGHRLVGISILEKLELHPEFKWPPPMLKLGEAAE